MNPTILAHNHITAASSTVAVTLATLDDQFAFYSGLEINSSVFTPASTSAVITVTATGFADTLYIKGDTSNVTALAITNSDGDTMYNGSINGATTYREFTRTTSGSSDQFTLTFTVTASQTFTLTTLYLGERIDLGKIYAGFKPVFNAEAYTSTTNVSKTGRLLGRRHTVEARSFNLMIKGRDVWWSENVLAPFLEDARVYAFIFTHDKARDDAFLFCWLERGVFPTYQNTLQQQISIPVKAEAGA